MSEADADADADLGTGTTPTDRRRPAVPFPCVHNAGRSQMVRGIDAVRPIRDDIEARVRDLLTGLGWRVS
ncbi:MAG: hypothetical protein JWM47_3677 [Acidimicrobiales bacterium]|nr:hypothetical protein [Acidimicrobiales bacterium]